MCGPSAATSIQQNPGESRHYAFTALLYPVRICETAAFPPAPILAAIEDADRRASKTYDAAFAYALREREEGVDCCDAGLFAAAYTEECVYDLVGQPRFEVGGVCNLNDNAIGCFYHYVGHVEAMEMMDGWVNVL